ncbi:hypothetical protein EYF80_047354 [Liparis tanakae]|uniref:Uncharacterized protein n=1 Tax=Liparis tanakae TaxID=230148 RepID=A0A4Z2FML2_9TELE|nr:hypothetical protein EYF80_047354 [Liparis tanakae]
MTARNGLVLIDPTESGGTKDPQRLSSPPLTSSGLHKSGLLLLGAPVPNQLVSLLPPPPQLHLVG